MMGALRTYNYGYGFNYGLIGIKSLFKQYGLTFLQRFTLNYCLILQKFNIISHHIMMTHYYIKAFYVIKQGLARRRLFE